MRIHITGGPLGSGESFDNYEIIEGHFLELTKIIPLSVQSFEVFSPRFGDIILRAGSNIDIFFREWLNCPEYNADEKALCLRKKKMINIRDYQDLFFESKKLGELSVYVQRIEKPLFPFKDWSSSSPPKWWSAYNKIKHDGFQHRNLATLENSLYSLAALFALHCRNIYSHTYLAHFFLPTPNRGRVSSRKVEYLKTPLDTRRYLFKMKSGFTTDLTR